MADVLRNTLLKNRNIMHRKVPGAYRVEQPKQKATKKSCFCGVETWEELLWNDWELGKEYTKLLIIKNVHSKLKKLKFRPPLSQVFTTPCPQIIILSPGTSFSLPVTFHPLHKCSYMDSIEFQCNDGTFQVKLHAVMLHHALELPDSVQLPVCAVRHTTSSSFLLHNVSKLQTRFQWAVEPPFEFSPLNGILEPGQQCRVTVTFKPQQALAYQKEASCMFGENGEDKCTMLIRGLSKYPHLQIRCPVQDQGCGLLEFGSVAIGSCLEKHFEIYNPSSVSTSFSLTRLKRPALIESVFQCDVTEKQVASNSVLRVPVCFTPLTVDSTSVEYFSLAWPGGFSKDLLKVTGTCMGPVVSLSPSVVDFGCVEAGGEAMRTVHLTNSSTVPAHYQLDTDSGNHSVFLLDKTSGTLAANSSVTLQLKFRPHHAIAYHKRLACLILHREPLFLDLIGTCHSEQLKPAVLHPRHLHAYSQNLHRGLTHYPPDLLSAMLAEHKLQLDENEALILQQDLSEDAALPRLPLSKRSPMEEYFHLNLADNSDESRDHCFPRSHVTVQPRDLLFHSGPSSQSVSITNHTKGKVCLMWTPAADSSFSVSPLMCDLNPLKSTAFRVTYTPKHHDGFQAAQLECFALYKVLRDHGEMEDWAMCLPWCLTVRVTAHCLKPGHDAYIPRFCLQHPQVLFSSLSQISYRSILLQNTGDRPLMFRLPSDECPAVSVLPSSGLVPPGGHQILTLRAIPAEDNPACLPLSLQLNSSPKHTQTLSVVCVAERPRVILDRGRTLFFRPAAPGFCTERTFRIRNFSRVSVHFQWKVCDSEHAVLSVDPDSGILQPNEFQVQTWSFTPLEKMMYRMKASLIFWPVKTPEYKYTCPLLKLVGLATEGSIEAEHSVMDLGEVLVGSNKSFEVPLLNRGSCDVSFSLMVHQRTSTPGLTEESITSPAVLEMDSMKGTIPAGCKLLIPSTVNLTQRAQYSWTICYQILSASGLPTDDPCSLCQVQAQGVYPTLEVTDARGSGSVEGLNKLHIWKLFSLSSLNTYLRAEPSPAKHSLRCSPPTSTMVDFNFGSTPLGADPSIFLLMFENTGSIPVEWSFLFLDDLNQMKEPCKAPFSIVPRSGKLQPGQQRAVQFTYRHDFSGIFNVPVLLRLFQGQEILLNFVGVTVEKDRCYLHITSTRHIFASVPMGLFQPPKQMYTMYNGGALPLRYHVDTSPLKQLQEENFNHPVLQCMNPDGEVQPGCTATLEWVFFPLEAKTYTVDIPIHVVDGDSVLVTFEGSGFDRRDPVPLQLHDGHFSVPSTQKLPLPGQMVFLSEESVCFGDLPVLSGSSRILFMTSVHTESVLYSWREQDGKQAVQISPASGSLSAGETVMCILSINTSNSPTFYQQDLICDITPRAAQAQYQIDLQRWEADKERDTLIEMDLMQTNPQSTSIQECTVTEQKSSSEIQKYKLLPPIRSGDSDTLLSVPAARVGKKVKDEAWRRRPEPPRSALLHLGVTARSHPLLEYKTQFPSEFIKHYIYRSVEPKLDRSLTHLPPLTHGPERDILTQTLSSLLRSLLDDPEFQQELQNVFNEPAPYFSQFRPASSETSPVPSPTISDTSKDISPAPYCTLSPGAVIPTHTHSERQCESRPREEVHPDISMEVRESIRRNPELCDLMEEILVNTLQNLMTEAFRGELVPTTHQRTIPVPPRSARSSGRNSRRQSRGHVMCDKDTDQEPPLGPSTGPSCPS